MVLTFQWEEMGKKINKYTVCQKVLRAMEPNKAAKGTEECWRRAAKGREGGSISQTSRGAGGWTRGRHLNKNLKEAGKPDIQISEEWEVQAKNIVRAKSLREGDAWLVEEKASVWLEESKLEVGGGGAGVAGRWLKGQQSGQILWSSSPKCRGR